MLPYRYGPDYMQGRPLEAFAELVLPRGVLTVDWRAICGSLFPKNTREPEWVSGNCTLAGPQRASHFRWLKWRGRRACGR